MPDPTHRLYELTSTFALTTEKVFGTFEQDKRLEKARLDAERALRDIEHEVYESNIFASDEREIDKKAIGNSCADVKTHLMEMASAHELVVERLLDVLTNVLENGVDEDNPLGQLTALSKEQIEVITRKRKLRLLID